MSYGQTLCGMFLDLLLEQRHIENYRPDWLNGLELDFYFPDLELGVEFQGDQHVVPTVTFGDCKRQQSRDNTKEVICHRQGISLLRVEAIDLEYTRMRGLLKRVLFKKFSRVRRMLLKASKDRYQVLNGMATAYRKTLIGSFNSPTARRKHNNNRSRQQSEASLREAYRLATQRP